MNELFPEQFAAAQKASLETFYGLANLSFESFQKLTVLNLQAARSALADTHKLLSAADPQVFFAQQASPDGGFAERIQAWQYRVYEIAVGTQTGFAAIAAAQYEAHNRRVQALFEDMSKQAPAGSEAAVAALKKLIDSSGVFYDSVNKSVRQAVNMAEGGFEAVLPRTSNASGATTG
ncbi:phasin family protein [Paraburkholderia sp. GAS206C]|uniref:TIGR01841 family phasin n=1 Tax=unclassified Paraburkholderia TaxID=2615204 RepID=UPI003D193FD7